MADANKRSVWFIVKQY